MKLKDIKRAHTQQQDQSDCGVACLQAAIKFYGGNVPLYRLRELSGTDKRGTTLWGLQEAAKDIGLHAQGMKADMDSLRACEDLCILHVEAQGQAYHYVLCYGYDEQTGFCVSDPATPTLIFLSQEELAMIWNSKVLLRLQPKAALETAKDQKRKQWEWIKSLVKEDINLLLMALLLGCGISVLSIANAVFSQQLIDELLPKGDWLRLAAGISALFAILLFQLLLTYARSVLLLTQSKQFNIRIVSFFYQKLLYLPKLFFDNRKVGDLVARMNDTRRIQNAISNILSNVMIDIILLVVATVVLFSYHTTIAYVSLLWMPIFSLIAFIFHPRILRDQRNVMQGYAQTESTFLDTIQGIDVIKTHGREALFTNMTTGVYQNFQGAAFQLGKTGLRYDVLNQLVGTSFFVLIITIGANSVLQGNLTTGSLMAVLQMIAVLMGAVSKLTMTNVQLQEAKVTLDRMFEYTSIEPEIDSIEPQEKLSTFSYLTAEGLSFGFPGRKKLFTDVNFCVHTGEWISILGESGCGKSTILQLLQKSYPYTDGMVRVNGDDFKGISTGQWRKKIGVVPQHVKIFNGTVFDNIVLGSQLVDPVELQSFFADQGFDPYFQQLPNGYHTIIGEEGINLSGGQKQLLGLARALFKKPQLLLLDEPTSALDRNTENFVLHLLRRLTCTMGIIVFTHKLKTAKVSDRIYIIGRDGRMECSGKHQELLQTENLYSNSWMDLVS